MNAKKLVIQRKCAPSSGVCAVYVVLHVLLYLIVFLVIFCTSFLRYFYWQITG